MQPFRRCALRVLSASNPPISISSRRINTLPRCLPKRILHQKFPSLLQRRFASEEAQTQSEPEADGATEAQHGDNSIAAASQEQAEPEYEEPALEDSQLGDPALGESQPEHPEWAASSDIAESASNAVEQISESGRAAAEGASNIAAGAADSLGLKESISQADYNKPSSFGSQSPKSNIVYVGNLFFDATDEDLKKEFGKCGEVVGTSIKTDARGLSRGFGYVTFSTEESAAKAIEMFNFKQYEGRRIVVSYPKSNAPVKQGSQSPTSTLFVGNMPFDMSDQELNQLFREVKNVTDVRVAIDRRSGQPRGFAHADFTDVESATSGLQYLRQKQYRGRVLRVDYGKNVRNKRVENSR